MENGKKIGIGSNILVIKDDKVLLGFRKNTVGDGTWGFPGGKLDFGEFFVDAARRELLEETNLMADELEFVGVNNYIEEANLHWVQINFLVTKWHGEVKLMESDKCERWEWFDMKKLPETMFKAHKDFIGDYLNKNFFREKK